MLSEYIGMALLELLAAVHLTIFTIATIIAWCKDLWHHLTIVCSLLYLSLALILPRAIVLAVDAQVKVHAFGSLHLVPLFHDQLEVSRVNLILRVVL